MPNTLAHIAVSTAIFRPLRIPLTAIFAGCIIPDLPWIMRRLVEPLDLAFDAVATVAYFTVQASLAGCLLPCLAFGLFFSQPLRIALIAFAGCAVHLLLDALQDKWGNGVHLVAPFDWQLLSFDVFPPDSIVSYVLTGLGVIPLLFMAEARRDSRLVRLVPARLAAALVCLCAWFALPPLFVDDLIASNTRGLQTLQTPATRAGKTLELDREWLSGNAGGWKVTTHTGELLDIVNPDAAWTDSGTYSIRARFVDAHNIEVTAWRRHTAVRDLASAVGVGLVSCWMLWVLLTGRRRGRDTF